MNSKLYKIIGVILLWTRFIVTRMYRSNLTYPSIIFHTSYVLAILCGFTIFFNFENDFLNVSMLSFAPHVSIVFFVNDIPILLNNPSIRSILDIATKHIPVGIVGFYIAIHELKLIRNSKEKKLHRNIVYAHIIWYFWFLVVDDHINNSYQGLTYVLIIALISVIWILLYLLVEKRLQAKFKITNRRMSCKKELRKYF